MKTKTGRADASSILVWLSSSLLTSGGKYSIIRCDKTLKNEKVIEKWFECGLISSICVPLKWLKFKRLTTLGVDKDMEQLELSYFAGRDLKGSTTLENYWVVS